MKITVKNILTEYPKIKMDLPEPLAAEKFEKVKNVFLPNYGKSEVIKKMVDTFVLKLNEAVAKQPKAAEPKAKAKEVAKPANRPQNVAELRRYLKKGMVLYFFYKDPNGWGKINIGRPLQTIQNNAVTFLTDKGTESWLHFPKASGFKFTDDYFAIVSNEERGSVMYYYYEDQAKNIDKITGGRDNKPAKAVKKSAKSVKKAAKTVKPDPIKIEHFTEDERLIRRFNNIIGKETARKAILSIYRDMEKRVTERKVNQDSTHAGVVKEIAQRLKKALDHMAKEKLTHINIEPADHSNELFHQVREIAGNKAIRISVNLLKRFIGIEGEVNPPKEKVKSIHAAFESATKTSRVANGDLYYAEVMEAKKAMEAYLEGKTEAIEVSPTGLKGIGEICGLKKKSLVKRSLAPVAKSTPRLDDKDMKNNGGCDLSGLEGTAETKESIAFNKSILEAKRNGLKPTTIFKLGYTKGELKKHIGSHAMFLNGDTIIKSMGKNKDHALLWHNLINLPDRLNNPAAIFKSTSKGHVVLTEIIDYRDKPVMAAIHFNEKQEIYDIKSMYARSSIRSYAKWKDADLLLWVNKKSDLVKRHLATIARATPKPHNKDTQKNGNSNLSGLEIEPVIANRFVVDLSTPAPAPLPVPPAVEEQPVEPKPAMGGLFSPITAQVPESSHNKIELPGDLGKFLGYVERYEYAILLRGEKGAGKTRLMYQLMNTFALGGFKVGCFSLEIGKQSNLVSDMRNTYISPRIANNVFIADQAPRGLEDIKEAAAQFDLVCIDSWGKIPGVKADDFDKLRKEHPKTMFIVIFQSTTNGTARGGSMPEYDAGIVIQVAEGGRAYCEKNRYSGDDFTFLVFQRKLEQKETTLVSL